MSQVTRCPSCGTRFKVVADQLRISQGWVRCGMCQSVFDASQDLQSVPEELLQSAVAQQAGQVSEAVKPPQTPVLEAESAAAARAAALLDTASVSGKADDAAPSGASVLAATEEAPTQEPLAEPEMVQPSFVDQARPLVAEVVLSESGEPQALLPDASQDQAQEPEPQAEPLSMQSEAAADEAAGAEVEVVSAQALLSTDMDAPRSEADAARPPEAEPVGSEEPAPAEEPGFVRQARRQAFWHSAGMRAALVLGSMLALAGVAAQYAWQQRDVLAAQHPALAPALGQACHLMGCELQARREIADVVISGSGFKQLADVQRYQWSLSLENRSDVPVAIPMAELTLTDAQDKPLLRRVIDLKPLGAPAQLLARQEWSVSVPVQVENLSAPVAGYRALVFYP
ncbi:DUF3426 domain-containing protein [Comamonas guangdongensis]|uniref:DUF3426 domain-containing protein n=1 Tax=Comamonas guangdongensis TaxID=510515 RepID=A0ABV3ZT47_9BURK